MSYSPPDPWTSRREPSAPEQPQAFPPDLTFPDGHHGYDPVAMPQPARRNRRRITGSLVVTAVVFAIASTTANHYIRNWLSGNSEVQEIAARTTVVAPAQLGGAPRATDPLIKEDLLKMRRAFDADPRLEEATASVIEAYGSPKKNDVVGVLAIAGPISSPEEQLDDFMKGLQDNGKVTYAELDPGPLGGVARCATAKLGGVTSGVCAWVDHGSLGALIYFNKPMSEQIKKRFLAARAQIEQRAPAPSS